LAHIRKQPLVAHLRTACSVPLAAVLVEKSSQTIRLMRAALEDADSDTHWTPQPLAEPQMAVQHLPLEPLDMATVAQEAALVVLQRLVAREATAGLVAVAVAGVPRKMGTAALAVLAAADL